MSNTSEKSTLKYSNEYEGPFMILFKDGTKVEVMYEDGGGSFVGSGAYDVYFYDKQENCVSFEQGDIEKVIHIESMEEVEFGNPYFPGHPRPKNELQT